MFGACDSIDDLYIKRCPTIKGISLAVWGSDYWFCQNLNAGTAIWFGDSHL